MIKVAVTGLKVINASESDICLSWIPIVPEPDSYKIVISSSEVDLRMKGTEITTSSNMCIGECK